MPTISSISGLRSTLRDGLNPDLIVNYSNALSLFLKEGTVVIGRDGRPSGEWIEKILVGVLNANGINVKLLGVVPTPTVQLIVEHSDSVCGIAITASHNPDEWNGLKFINSDGVFFDKEENERLWDYLDKNINIETNEFGSTEIVSDALKKHIEKIMSLEEIKKDSKHEIVAVVDAVNASGSEVVPKLLKKLNVKVVELFCDGSGIFPHTPEPIPDNLVELANAVKEHKADIGIAVDPDADRLVLIDETGRPIGEEKTIVLAAKSVIESNSIKSGNLVINLSTSAMLEKYSKSRGLETFRSAVGEINVVKKMKETNAIFGGEGSGGVIYPKVHYGRDSLVGIALVISLMQSTNKKLSELDEELPNLYMDKTKFPFEGDFEILKNKILNMYPNLEVDTIDGVRLKADDYWLQVRKSNTEPIVRIIVESDSKELNLELIKNLKKVCLD